MVNMMRVAGIIICLFLLTGCWDKVEIEQRSFVYGIAIDLSENRSKENREIKITQQFVIPENLATTGNGAGSGAPYQNLSGNGNTIFEINRKIMRQENLKTDVTHLKVVLFSKELVEKPKLYEGYLDVFLREKDMRRGIKTAVVNGEAHDMLTVSSENEKLPAQYINDLLDNPQKFEVLDLVVIGDLQEKLFLEESFALPLLTIKSNEGNKLIDYEGIAVYNGKKHQVVGEITGDAVKGLSIIRGKKNTGTINVTIAEKTTTFEIINLKARITLENKEINDLKFTVNVDLRGSLAEQYGSENIEKEEVIQTFEEAIEKKTEEKMKKAIDRLQNELQTDVLGIGNYLSHFHPKIWKKIKDDWDYGENYFSKSDITTNVNVTIDKPGSVNRTTVNGGK